MILSNNDLNVEKVRGWVTEVLLKTETRAIWIALNFIVPTPWLQMTSRGKMAAPVSAVTSQQWKEAARALTEFLF